MTHSRRHRRSRPAGFTLIEVLLAVFIIGLGAIGLFALFAGVAEQQRRAAEVTQAVGITQTMMGMLRSDRVGLLDEPRDPTTMPPFTAPFNDPKFGEPLRAGVWYPAFVYDNPTDPDYGYTLSIAPADEANPNTGRYFVVDAPEVEIYSNPASFNGTTFQPSTGSLQGGVSPQWSGAGDFNAAPVLGLTQQRLHPGSLRVVFSASNTATGNERTVAEFDDLDLLINPPLNIAAYDFITLAHPLTPTATIDLNYALRSWADLTNDPIGLVGFNLDGFPLQPNEWISSIRVQYRYRNDRLLSLSDRLVTVPDDDAEGGRRAEYGSTVFYRRTASGATQVAILTYSVRPVGRGGRFVPPERFEDFEDDEGLIREVFVNLGYDEDAGLYFIEPVDADANFLVRTDQILLFGGERRAPAANPAPLETFGADQPVRVTRVTGDITSPDLTRLYLDEAPRAGFRSLNGPRDRRVTVPVFALNSTVRSLDDDRSRWIVRPVEMRIVDLR